jgi:hypothetical protein
MEVWLETLVNGEICSKIARSDCPKRRSESTRIPSHWLLFISRRTLVAPFEKLCEHYYFRLNFALQFGPLVGSGVLEVARRSHRR